MQSIFQFLKEASIDRN